jgi:thioredoxin-dependent peroxiredoxin
MATNELKIGDTAPDFEMLTDQGSQVKLSDFRGKRVILYFYPEDDTPGCIKQACGFRDHFIEIEEKNAIVLGVSPDNVGSHQKFKTKYNLPFTLLVDEGHKIAELYGTWGPKSFFGKDYEGVIRSHFVIDEQGQLIDVQYKINAPDSVAKALESIGIA